MKKFLLSVMSLAFLAVGANAQQLNRAGFATSDFKQVNKNFTHFSGPKKAEAQQLLIGLDGSDLSDESKGLNLVGFPSWQKATMVLAAMPQADLAQFKGYKLVGFRYAVSASLGKTPAAVVFVYDGNSTSVVTGADLTDYKVCEFENNMININWNVVAYDQAYTITGNEKEILFGFEYTQSTTKSGTNYADECYPFLLGETSASYKNALLVYGLPANAKAEDEGLYTITQKTKVYTPAFQMIAETPEGQTAIIGVTTSNDANATHFYTIDGKQLTTPQKGLNIVKMSDGTSRKLMVK